MANEAKIKFTAEDATGAAFAAIGKNIGNLKSELALMPAQFAKIAIASAGLASISGFASIVTDAIEAKSRLLELSTQTNISVEALSSLGKVGKYSNTSLDDIASASNKLSKALFSQTEDSKGAAQAIAALGLNFDQFKSLQPEQQMLAIAKALDTFQDGSEKSAAAMLLFGKQGAQLLPFLKELAERGLSVTKETTASAKAAKEYEDNLIALKSAGDEWKKTLVNDMLPSLVEFSRELVEGRKAYGGWFAAIRDIGWNVDPFASQGKNIRDASDELGKYQQEMAQVQAAEKAPLANLAVSMGARDKAAIQADIDTLTARKKYLLAIQSGQALDLGRGVADDPRIRERKKKLVLPDAGGASKDGDGRALLKKQFEGQLELLKELGEQQKSLLDANLQYLRGDYDAGNRSLDDYLAKQRELRAEGVQDQIDAFDQEIAAAEAFKAKADKPQDRQDADNKISASRQKRAAVIAKAAQDEILAEQEEAKAVKALAYTYYEYLANVKTLQGDVAGASAIRIAKQVQDAQEQLRKVGFDPSVAQAQADAYGKLLANTEALTRAQSDYARLVDVAGVAEKNAQLDAAESGLSEIDTLKQIGAIRQGALGDLAALVDKARELAQVSADPAAALAYAKLALQYKQAAAEADPLLQKIRDIGTEAGNAIGSQAEQAIVQWQGARKLLSSIEQDLLRIGTHALVTKPLEDYLGNILGGNGQASGGGGLLGSLAKSLGLLGDGTTAQDGALHTTQLLAQNSASVAATTALTALTQAASSAAAALGGVGGGSASGGGLFGGFLNTLGLGGSGANAPGGASFGSDLGFELPTALATGTNYVPQDMLALLHEGEAVVPKQYNDGGSGGKTLNFTLVQQFPPGTNTATVNQAAKSAGDVIARAQRRNG